MTWSKSCYFTAGDVRSLEVCNGKAANFSCAQDEVILMQKAEYGRMNMGICVKKNLGNYRLHEFLPHTLKGCQGIVFTHSVRMDGRARGCRCATSWCNLDLTFAVVTLSLNIFSGLYLRNYKV